MTYKLGSPTGLMNHWGLFELSCKNGRFLAIFSVFRPKIGDLWPFDPKKGSSYKLLPPEITYSEGIVARQRESLEKGVTRANFSVLRPQIGDLWPFDPKKGSSYKILPPEITYSEGVVALQWESVEKGVTRTKVPKNVTLIALADEPVDLLTFRKVPSQALA